ncbi:MAG: GTP-binding protein [Lachnospiraceae bacterium]|nr:GTP-binding protein [Lachnospiraceae bacterium]
MKILIVSGFLGAGKTTFIKSLSKHTGREIAILENEYGEVGVDGDVLRANSAQSVGKVNIWELTEGCICCSTKGDFAASVLTIANTVDPEYLVVEPTGVGMLSNIIANLQQIEYERITLLAPVTVVDGQSFHSNLREYPEIYKDQIREARTVFVSKLENASPEERQKIRQDIEALHPAGQIMADHYSGMEETEWLSLLERSYDGSRLEARPESAELPDTFSMSGVEVESPEMLLLLLERLIHGGLGGVVRAKGCIRTGDEWLRFDAVDGRYSLSGAEAAPEGKAVFIGTDIRRQTIRRYFSKTRRRPRIGKNGSRAQAAAGRSSIITWEE